MICMLLVCKNEINLSMVSYLLQSFANILLQKCRQSALSVLYWWVVLMSNSGKTCGLLILITSSHH